MKPLASYMIGFVASLMLTLMAFELVKLHVDSGHLSPTHEILVPALFLLAIIQLIAQTFFFLDLGVEKKPHMRTWFFVFALQLVCIVVAGSVWIMNNLDYRMTGPDMNMQLMIEEGYQR